MSDVTSQRSGMMGGKWPEQAQRQIHLSQPTGKGLLIAAVMKHWNQKQLRIHHGGEALLLACPVSSMKHRGGEGREKGREGQNVEKGREERTGSREKIYTLRACPVLPSPKLYLLNLPQTVPPTNDQVGKCPSLWKTFLIQRST